MNFEPQSQACFTAEPAQVHCRANPGSLPSQLKFTAELIQAHCRADSEAHFLQVHLLCTLSLETCVFYISLTSFGFKEPANVKQ